jgi:hypothetical protein
MAMSQSRPDTIIRVEGEDLGLVRQTPDRRREENPVVVTLQLDSLFKRLFRLGGDFRIALFRLPASVVQKATPIHKVIGHDVCFPTGALMRLIRTEPRRYVWSLSGLQTQSEKECKNVVELSQQARLAGGFEEESNFYGEVSPATARKSPSFVMSDREHRRVDGRQLRDEIARGGDMVATRRSGRAAQPILFRPNLLILLVEPDGIEPTTSSMPLKRSPN